MSKSKSGGKEAGADQQRDTEIDSLWESIPSAITHPATIVHIVCTSPTEFSKIFTLRNRSAIDDVRRNFGCEKTTGKEY